ncbi:DUF411 domain-containing protein [Synechocystis sp. PCC 7509]|uniref:DUF411 domain-containing protein n=1 Tax=Synechocystis sp. PCC 7509 TaxID=927677 RepID=UPI0002AC5EDB|nr:DUF411 domain-containing protein [Synechocystis sp. PCC 7509]
MNKIKRLIISWIAIAFIVLLATTSSAQAANLPEAIMYRDPACTCCGSWMKHLQSQGFSVKNVPVADIFAFKHEQGVTDDLASCHTAIIDGYVVEGHVPGDDIKRLLAQKPDITGIAVPGMPVGTPGMEMGSKKDSYAVVSFDKQGQTKVFKQYSF